jgi:hypothetical protein
MQKFSILTGRRQQLRMPERSFSLGEIDLRFEFPPELNPKVATLGGRPPSSQIVILELRAIVSPVWSRSLSRSNPDIEIELVGETYQTERIGESNYADRNAPNPALPCNLPANERASKP